MMQRFFHPSLPPTRPRRQSAVFYAPKPTRCTLMNSVEQPQTRERRSYHTKFEISQQTRFFTYFLTLFCAIFIFTGYYN